MRPIGPRRFIAVAGNIGVGKSTLVDFLCQQYPLRPQFEPNQENPYLADFYRDMQRYAFHSQIYFLTRKFGLHQSLNESPVPIIQDRTIYEDAEIFAANLAQQKILNATDYSVYRELYRNILRELRPPDLMIYLKASTKTLERRIKLRGRPEEQSLPKGYLAQLQVLYEEWFARFSLSETLVIETDRFDYLYDLVDRIDLFERIDAALA